MKYTIENESYYLECLASRTDHTALQIRRMTALPDLSRTSGSPVYYVTEAIKQISSLVHFDSIEIPQIVPVELNFDLLGFPPAHPGRSNSDSYYLTNSILLRTQTTTMWPYYLRDQNVLSKLQTSGSVGALCHGKVYRKDEIDRNHYPVFHQIDGLKVTRTRIREYTVDDLAAILVEIARSVFGSQIQWRIEPDTFPFTNPSIQLLIYWNDQWLEIVGAGLVNKNVLALLGIDPGEYNGWAFGFGLDRIAMIKMNIPDIRILWSTDDRIKKQFTGLDSSYVAVSKYPPTDRDISMIVKKEISLNLFYETMRDCGYREEEDLIEEVRLIDTFENTGKFGKENVSYTFRITYRSHLRTLTTEEINSIQESLRLRVVEEFNAVLR